MYSCNVYISGAYEDSKENEDSANCAYTISEWLIEKGYRIYTGYGKNMGAEVVAGAFSGYQKARRKMNEFEDYVHIVPFPWKSSMSRGERNRMYSDIRSNSIARTQFTIIINGTKRDKTKLIASPGVKEEASISLDQENVVIPVAFTGGAALEVWEELRRKNLSYTHTDAFKKLKSGSTIDEAITAVKEIITASIRNVV